MLNTTSEESSNLTVFKHSLPFRIYLAINMGLQTVTRGLLRGIVSTILFNISKNKSLYSVRVIQLSLVKILLYWVGANTNFTTWQLVMLYVLYLLHFQSWNTGIKWYLHTLKISVRIYSIYICLYDNYVLIIIIYIPCTFIWRRLI